MTDSPFTKTHLEENTSISTVIRQVFRAVNTGAQTLPHSRAFRQSSTRLSRNSSCSPPVLGAWLACCICASILRMASLDPGLRFSRSARLVGLREVDLFRCSAQESLYVRMCCTWRSMRRHATRQNTMSGLSTKTLLRKRGVYDARTSPSNGRMARIASAAQTPRQAVGKITRRPNHGAFREKRSPGSNEAIRKMLAQMQQASQAPKAQAASS